MNKYPLSKPNVIKLNSKLTIMCKVYPFNFYESLLYAKKMQD